ncbi:hypothetical protein I553_8206 [Mycobacterium xenopi 4042]|uniref:Uncharacterized protein n=1 Tax=Mycobacterium xenopi 4042 TaxID=1299334 RepID=X8DD81_MYCXE|nr:hypothetical protein I553_8206 [Mycobacterium xenopi 4042]
MRSCPTVNRPAPAAMTNRLAHRMAAVDVTRPRADRPTNGACRRTASATARSNAARVEIINYKASYLRM